MERAKDRPKPQQIEIADVLLEGRLKGLERLAGVAECHMHPREHRRRDIAGLRQRLQAFENIAGLVRASAAGVGGTESRQRDRVRLQLHRLASGDHRLVEPPQILADVAQQGMAAEEVRLHLERDRKSVV